MRIWSIHPKYLDSKGIVALWRETLLAKKVLEGKTKGYKNHPQLNRFRNSVSAVDCINHYLNFVYDESVKRGYNFDKKKIDDFVQCELNVTKGQLKYEFNHLLKKLKLRDTERYNKLSEIVDVEVNPFFKIIDGEIEDWEITDIS